MEDILFDFYALFAPFELVADLYQDKALLGFLLVLTGFSLIMPFLFYYVLDHPNYRQTKHWIYFMLGNFTLVTLFHMIAFYVKKTQGKSASGAESVKLFNYDWTVFLTFSLEMGVISMICYTLFSIAIFKYISTNCNNTPF